MPLSFHAQHARAAVRDILPQEFGTVISGAQFFLNDGLGRFEPKAENQTDQFRSARLPKWNLACQGRCGLFGVGVACVFWFF
jgi:hypothetical protein